MILKDFLPSPELQEFVRWYRIVHFEFDKIAAIPAKAYPPKPEHVLHFFLKERFSVEDSKGNRLYQPPVTLIGQRTFVTKQYNESKFLNFQIVFQPTALFRLTGIPGYEVTNTYIHAEDIFSKDIFRTYEQLQFAENYSGLLSIGENFVRNLLKKARSNSHKIDSLIRLITDGAGNTTLRWLAQESCLCTKQYERKFFERTGVNPKTFSRIVRFNRAYNFKNRYPERTWFQVAIDTGYFDYQHLVRDYRNFTGLNPNEFHHIEKNSPEYFLGLTNEVYRSRICEIGS